MSLAWWRSRCGLWLALLLLLFLAAWTSPAGATTFSELPPSLQALSGEAFWSLFTITFERPYLAAEIARLRLFTEPDGAPTDACPALAQLIATYPGTADARRALLDIGVAYAQEGDWRTAEAPFRYVMEQKSGWPEARIAHLRLLEMYRYSGVPEGVDLATALQAAVQAYVGTPEEGYGRLLLGDVLVEQVDFPAAFAEYQQTLERFPLQPYTDYVRIHYALALVRGEKTERAIQVLSPILADPVWGGRAYYVRGAVHEKLAMPTAAVVDYEIAACTADSLWFRSEAYRELARLHTQQGDLARASICLQASLDAHPFRGDIPPLKIDMLRNLVALGELSQAAALATQLQRDVQNPKWHFPPVQVDYAQRTCEEILLQCRPAQPAFPKAQEVTPAEALAAKLEALRTVPEGADAARTAVQAMQLRMAVENDAERYPPEQVQETVRTCLEVMRQCEQTLNAAP